MASNKVFKSNVVYMSGSGYSYPRDHSLYIARGAGVGSIFSSLYSSLIPIVKSIVKVGSKAVKSDLGKSILKDVKKTATQAGLTATGEVLQGENVLKASKRALKNVGTTLAKQAKTRGERALAAAIAPIHTPKVKKTKSPPISKSPPAKKPRPPRGLEKKKKTLAYNTKAKATPRGKKKKLDILD